MSIKLLLFSLVALSAFVSGSSVPGTIASDPLPSTTFSSSLRFWTPQALLSANPISLSVAMTASGVPVGNISDAETYGTGPAFGEGARASLKVPSDLPRRLISSADLLAYAQRRRAENSLDSSPEDVIPFDYSTNSNPFTSSRVFPDVALRYYPLSTHVKIFFTSWNGINYVCSGSLIKRGIVSTAGHCIHPGDGNPAHFHRNFLIVPAFDNGAAPYGSWTATRLYVTSTWYSGGGGVPNAADYGFIVLNPNSVGRFAGHYTGFLGYQTQSVRGNHVSVFGYPCNHDACRKLHTVTGQVGTPVYTNTVLMGSDMRGGSSGGPWVQNFHVLSGGQTPRSPSLRIVGIVSYGPVSTAYNYQGSSIPDARFVNALNTACAAYPTRCGA